MRDMIDRTQATRLDGQDYPRSVEDRLAERREVLLDHLVAYSSSGRMKGQDSQPPTPRLVDDPAELVTANDFFTGSKRNSLLRSTSTGSGKNQELLDVVGAEEKKSSSVGSGTLRKVAGYMRKKSTIGLGLKAPQGTGIGGAPW
jgi:hypothetical protein